MNNRILQTPFIFKYSFISILLYTIYPPLGVAPVLIVAFKFGIKKALIYVGGYFLILLGGILLISLIKAPYQFYERVVFLIGDIITFFYFVIIEALIFYYLIRSKKLDLFYKILIGSISFFLILVVFVISLYFNNFSLFSFSKLIEFINKIPEFSNYSKEVEYLLTIIVPRSFFMLSFFNSFIVLQHFSFYNKKHLLIEFDKIENYKLNFKLIYLLVIFVYLFLFVNFIIKVNNRIIKDLSYNFMFFFIGIFIVSGISYLAYLLNKKNFLKYFDNTIFIVILVIALILNFYYIMIPLLSILFILGISDSIFNLRKKLD